MTNKSFDFKNVENFKLVKVYIKNIEQVNIESWRIELYNEDNEKSVFIMADVGQTTSILYGLSKTPSLALSPSVHQLIKNISEYNNMKIKSIIINHVEDMLSQAKIEFQNKNDLVYFDIASGDALALASINNIPIYTTKNLLQELEEDEIEIILE